MTTSRRLPLVAGKIQCPACGHPFRDVDPEFVMDNDKNGGLGGSWLEQRIMGKCLTGHIVGVLVQPGRITVEVIR